VNDGSTDGTQAILDRLASSFSDLVILGHAENRGYGATLTSGCDRATRDVLGFMDSDGQFRASDLSLLIPHLAAVPFVAGVRMRRADPAIRLANGFLYNWLVRWTLEL